MTYVLQFASSRSYVEANADCKNKDYVDLHTSDHTIARETEDLWSVQHATCISHETQNVFVGWPSLDLRRTTVQLWLL